MTLIELLLYGVVFGVAVLGKAAQMLTSKLK